MPAQKRERQTVAEALRQRRAKHLKRLKRFKEAQAKAKAEANDIVKRQLAYKYDEVNEDLATPARRTDRAISADELASAIGTAIKAAKRNDYSSDEGEE